MLTPRTTIRVEPSLIEEAAAAAGLPADNVSHVIRYALAALAGRPDTDRAARLRMGRRVLA